MSSVSSDVFLDDEKLQQGTDESYVEMEIFDIIDQARRDNAALTRKEEITIAVDFCKEKLRLLSESDETEEDRTLRQGYLDKLVQLGLEKQTMEDEDGEKEEVVRVRGHSFVIQPIRGRNPTCEVCMTTIWKLMHAWRRCKYCGLRTHSKCSSSVGRVCASSIVSRRDFVLNTWICQEKGLAAQNYRCHECAHPLSFEGSSSLEPRLCDYSGLYFCSSCHWNDQMAIPARVLHNLDSEPRPVSRASKQLLAMIDNRPLLPLASANPMLIKLNSNLKRITRIRNDFLFMKCYFVSCRSARQLRILQYLCRHQHFVESPDLYTMAEMRDIVSGKLLEELEDIHQVFMKHITEECETCKGNAFVCELCPDKQIIFPFSDNISMCIKCLAVFHHKCKCDHKCCPRCERRSKRAPIEIDPNERL
ncbi:hypothetical protein PENTCL1PPCAC_11584 [Pristionchus entomophagus]|uniref:Phorbol-ester/DAG-type domain-containing protein n=1 Tax=Pristionchus entomophagus TaxID=358040 RepID=A0AAV5T9U9_9BILA|nr:hypothetical protein PENTCL1PPCAC_11584 [Pristionchus entomophagus]